MSNIINLFKNEESRNKLIVLFICLGIFKFGMHVHVPFINRSALEQFGQGEGMFSMMNSFTGGALSTFSIFAVGIMPYITASIIVQLLQMDVVPKFTEWKSQGEYGQRKLKQTTYALTIVFALVQSIAITLSFNQMYAGLVENPNLLKYLTITSVLTLGTIILVVMGEIIEKKGIGKGISIIILAGILMTLPDAFAQYYTSEFTGNETFLSIIKTLILVLFVYCMLLSIIVVNGGERKIPIQSSNMGKYGAVSRGMNHLPIKINSAGVIPVIFASALFMMPVTILQLFDENKVAMFFQNYLSFNSISGISVYGLLIIMFTYFYSFVQIDPEKLADNLHKDGKFIPGIRPGQRTKIYLTKVLVRLTFVGALFLAMISITPMILGQVIVLPQQLVMIGTSLIIIVSVVVDLNTELQIEMNKSKYTFFKENKKRTLWG